MASAKQIRLVTEDKRRTWIKLTFVPSCAQMRLQLLHFHGVFKTSWTLWDLMSIFSSSKRLWKTTEFHRKQWNQRKYMLTKTRELRRNIFYCFPTLPYALHACVYIYIRQLSSLGCQRCGLWIWLSLLAIFNTLFWVYADSFFTTENGQNTKILEVDVSTGAQSINTERASWSESPLFHISSHSKAFFSSSYISPCEKLRLKVTSTCLNRTVPTHKLGPSKYWKAKLAADRMRQFQL